MKEILIYDTLKKMNIYEKNMNNTVIHIFLN